MALSSYVAEIRRCVERQDGQTLRQAFQLNSQAMMAAMQISQRGGVVPSSDIQRQLPEPWADIVLSFISALVLVAKGDHVGAYREYSERHAKGLISAVKDEVWVVPPVIGMAVTLKALAERADQELTSKGQRSSMLDACARVLQGAFAATAPAAHRNPEKKAAAVAITCTLLKVYFKNNTINNCRPSIATIEKIGIDTAPAAYRVTFRYYTGRLAAYDEDFSKADEHLTYALSHCPPGAAGAANKRKVLRYLVPVKMLQGWLPSEVLLQRHGLQEYAAIVQAMRTGDVALLLRTLETFQAAFVVSGTYLLLEKLQLAVFRRLFKRCYLLHASAHPAKAHQVPMALFQRALELQGVARDDMETQCILANLIFRKYIKGYLAYKSRVAVLAKTDPFPPLASVLLSDPTAL